LGIKSVGKSNVSCPMLAPYFNQGYFLSATKLQLLKRLPNAKSLKKSKF